MRTENEADFFIPWIRHGWGRTGGPATATPSPIGFEPTVSKESYAEKPRQQKQNAAFRFSVVCRPNHPIFNVNTSQA